MRTVHGCVIAMLLAMQAILSTAYAGDAPVDVAFFKDQVEPILREHCYKCHDAAAEAAKKLKGKLRMDTWVGLAKGGESKKPAVIPGEPGKSTVITSMRSKDEEEQMPPSSKPRVPDPAIALVERWIAGGAPHPERDTAVAPATTGTTPPDGGKPSPGTAPTKTVVTDGPPPFFGRLHPVIVHFPIACLFVTLFAEFLLLVRLFGTDWEPTVRLSLAVALVGAIAAVISGLMLADEDLTATMWRHRLFGFITLGTALLGAGCLWQAARRQSVGWRWAFRLVLLAAVILVGWTGHLGGAGKWGHDWLF